MRGPVLVSSGQAVADDVPPVLRKFRRQPQLVLAPGVAQRGVPAGGGGAAGQWQRAGQDDVGQYAEGPDVGRRTDLRTAFADLGPEQVRRGVVGRGEGRGVGVGALQLRGHVEVAQPRRAVGHQQDVARLEVAVHPARPVQLVEPLADLGEQGGPGPWHSVGQQGVQGALRLLQDEDGGAVEFGPAGVVDREHLVQPDQPGGAHPAQYLGLALGELDQVP